MKKILVICPYPTGLAPSQRFRFEQYLSHLKKKGFDTVLEPFFTEKAYRALSEKENTLSKIRAIIESYLRRLSLLLHIRPFDLIFIHREAAPAGPPVIEWWLAKVLKKKLIYDFDDAIWLTDRTDESRVEKFMRWRSKVKWICKWSYRVSCGNAYLAEFARRYNPNVIIMPTTIDTVHLHTTNAPVKKENEKVTIGWTGSHSTLKYLDIIVPVLKSLEAHYPQVETLVIADRNPHLPLQKFKFLSWSKQLEIEDLRRIDIGVMPLPDNEWTRGKCGFKALQYMSLGIPAVISPVGVNREILTHGVEGYLCSTATEWFSNLSTLIEEPEKRRTMGKRGVKKVASNYSLDSNSITFLSLFE